MILQAFKFTNVFLAKHFLNIFKISIFPVLFNILLIYWNKAYFRANPDTQSPIMTQDNLLTTLFSGLISLYVFSLLVQVVNDHYKKEKRTLLNYYFQAFYYLPNVFLASLIVGLAVAGGLMLFIVPGIYLLGRLLLVQLIVIVENKNFVESFSAGQDYAKGYSWTLSLAFLWLLCLFILISIPFSSLIFSPLGEISSLWIMASIVLALYNHTLAIYTYVFVYSLYLAVLQDK